MYWFYVIKKKKENIETKRMGYPRRVPMISLSPFMITQILSPMHLSTNSVMWLWGSEQRGGEWNNTHPSCTHTYTHNHTHHTTTHSHNHTSTHPHIHTSTHSHIHTFTQPHIHTTTHSHIHTFTRFDLILLSMLLSPVFVSVMCVCLSDVCEQTKWQILRELGHANNLI